MRFIIILLIAFECAVLRAAPERVHIIAVATAANKQKIPNTDVTVDSGYAISVLIINSTNNTITLPSRMMGPHIITKDERIECLFTYYSTDYLTKSGKHPVIPSRETLGPVTLKPGEAMRMDPDIFALEARDIKSKPVYVVLRTGGILADRLGFSDITTESKVVHYSEYSRVPSERREP